MDILEDQCIISIVQPLFDLYDSKNLGLTSKGLNASVVIALCVEHNEIEMKAWLIVIKGYICTVT